MVNPVEVENLSFSYPLYRNPRDVMVEMLTRKPRHEDFWALRDISFSLSESDRLGVIGHNGSGKSTLLKILTGHLQPMRGRAQVHGRISAMLGMNAVMNPEETGISNIRLNLILNGHPKHLVSSLTEEIVEFTELGPFIFSPVKTYSSGMNAKLAFAINTAVEPDILMIDEVLSVGDSYFVGKATRRMKELCDKGRALIFVSHSTAAVQMLCTRVLWLDNGQVRMLGPADSVLAAYEEDYRRFEDEQTRTGNATRASTQVLRPPGDPSTNRFARLRIVPGNESGRFIDTHYVRNMRLESGALPPTDIPLELIDDPATGEGVPHLDVLASEWGRLVTRDGSNTRILSSRTGRIPGGQILLPITNVHNGVTVRFEYSSIQGDENLKLQIFDYGRVEWTDLTKVDETRNGPLWRELAFKMTDLDLDTETIERALAEVARRNLPDASISDVSILVDESRVTVVNSHDSFRVRVDAEPNRACGDLDVGIKIIRSDGVYVFWQSSGSTGHPVKAPVGRFAVEFCFPSGLLGQGDYDISAFISNGWDYPSNYPYSIVHDRKVSALRFTVRPRFPDVDLGVLAQQVPVIISGGDLV